ncbi:unnamed protein product [Rotaria sp. Silwood1]|nr:unnamed protein product [Rotaria sp. Silwood1]CAF1666581.1 unnamed protein product [Rotaria sp. Silwood1]CAF5021243.1 unnamed protein product [Rotaria sp. Silwood1]
MKVKNSNVTLNPELEIRKRINETLDRQLEIIKRTNELKRQIKEAIRQQTHEAYQRKTRKLDIESDSSSTKKRRNVFTFPDYFCDIDIPDELQSFDMDAVLNDNNYIKHYSNQFSSYSKLNEEEIQKGFDQLIVNILNILNNSTSLKYLDTSSSYYLANKFNPHYFIVSFGNLMSPYVSLSADSMIEEILQYLTMILTVQHHEKIYGFLSNYTHIKFFYVKKKSDSEWYEFFQSQELEMFTYSSETLSSIDTSTTVTTTENTRKLDVNKDTWKIFTNFLTMNTDFYQYTRLNIDPHDDLLGDRYIR